MSDFKFSLKDFFEWDFITWGRSINLFRTVLEEYTQENPNSIALEIGSRNGGLYLWLAYNYNIKILCTDLISPEKNCKFSHAKYQLSGKITYESLNILDIHYPDASIDIVVFKSVIGALGSRINQERAINEIYRVLKPGGILLFAENARASNFHMFFRLKFNKWSKYWHYPDVDEMNSLLKNYKYSKIETTGVMATFFRKSYLNKVFAKLDLLLMNFISRKFHYVLYGYAKK